jgi:hypothetical protein
VTADKSDEGATYVDPAGAASRGLAALMLWIGVAIIGLLVGRYLPIWVVLVFPGLIIGLGS